jgi:membrane protease YdiL (CAAX protease family)
MAGYRIPIAIVAVAAWVVITVWGVWVPHEPTSLSSGLETAVAWPIVAAGAFLFALSLAMRWDDLGFNAPRPWSSLRILFLPSIYFVLFIGFALVSGLPSPSVMGFLAFNTLAVGFSEEIAFRGVLFRALHTRLRLWPAIWITSVAFGSVHIINGFTTGDFGNAAIQATAAFMSGIFFMAVVLRTGSIIPAMLFHGFWDFLLTTISAGAASGSGPVEVTLIQTLMPVLFVLPNFLYGLWLLRKVEDRGRAGEAIAGGRSG